MKMKNFPNKNYVCVLMKTEAIPGVLCSEVYGGSFLCAIYDKDDRNRKHLLDLFESDTPKAVKDVAKDLTNSIFWEKVEKITTLPGKAECPYFAANPVGRAKLNEFASYCLEEIGGQRVSSK